MERESTELLDAINLLLDWSDKHSTLNRYIQILYATKKFDSLLIELAQSVVISENHKNLIACALIEQINNTLSAVIVEGRYDIISAIINHSHYHEFCMMFYNISVLFAIQVSHQINPMQTTIASHFNSINPIYRKLARAFVKKEKYYETKTQYIELGRVIKCFDVINTNINGMYLLSQSPNVHWRHIKTITQLEWHPHGVSRNPNITWDIVEDNPDYPWSYYDLSFNPNITEANVLDNLDKGWCFDWIIEKSPEISVNYGDFGKNMDDFTDFL